MRRRVLALFLAGVAVTVAGCGSGESIGEAASAALAPQVAAVRVAAAKGDRAEALTKLAAVRQTVAGLRTSGDLSEEGAARVLEAAAEVERQLALLPEPVRAGGSGAPATTSGGVRDEQQRKAEEDVRKRAEEAAKKAEEEARKRAEEAAKKAEEEAKKRAEDARKRAEEGKKD